MKHKHTNSARNIWERACKHHPRVDQFWYKYAYMEEMLENTGNSRKIFQDWMTWEPTEKAWEAYVQFEVRMKRFDLARGVLEQFIKAHPDVASYMKAAKFEENQRNSKQAREIYERAIAELGQKVFDESFFIQFTRFE